MSSSPLAAKRYTARSAWAALALPLVVAGAACRDAPQPPPASPRAPAATRRPGEPLAAAARAALGQDRELTLSRAGMPFRGLARALGAHEVRCRSSLRVTGVRAPRTVTQEVQLHVDAQGSHRGRRHTHAQHGEEFTWIDGWLYSRGRYSRFVKRRAARSAVERRADRAYGLLPAYLELLRHALAVSRAGTARVGDRPAVKVALTLRGDAGRGAPAATGPARRWRQHVTVKELAGTALLDAATGAPLSVDLRARWAFAPPAAEDRRTGIPGELDTARTGEMALTFEQRVTRVGRVAPIGPPPEEDVLVDARRLRLERERQYVAGERSLPRDWPRVEPLTDPGARR